MKRNITLHSYQSKAREIIRLEAGAIAALETLISDDFGNIVEHILNSKGRVVVTGMGKSGIIARKIAATFASTGTMSFYLHPAEGTHGDLGIIGKQDIVIALSNSGETSELINLIPFIKENRNLLIGVTGNMQSTLAVQSDFVLNAYVEKEACPLELAPTSSTTAMLVLGDALAMTVMEAKGFKAENFARFHPGGTLGRKLLNTVDDYMQKENLPVISKTTPAQQLIHIMTSGKLGLAIVMENDRVEGVVTDGDLRRAMEKYKTFDFLPEQIMTPHPKTVDVNTKLKEAEEIMNNNKITSLLVMKEHELKGVIQIYDIDKI